MDDRFGPVEWFAAYQLANELAPAPLAWLWPARIPMTGVTLIIGDPGVGKSLLAADLAARVSVGLPWPDASTTLPHTEEPGERATPLTTLPHREGPGEGLSPFAPPPLSASPARRPSLPLGAVTFVSPEDDPAEVVVPRLSAAGANLSLVCIVTGASRTWKNQVVCPLLLPDHLDALQHAIRGVDFRRLVILDPLHAMLSPTAQASPAILLQVLAGLAETASSYGVAIIATGHLTKSSFCRTLYRIRGSVALTASARAIHLLSADPDQPDRRILSPLKTVYGPPPPALAFRITPSQISNLKSQSASAPRLVWETAPAAPPLDLLDSAAELHSAVSEACDWLDDYLSSGPRPARDLIRAARAAGLAMDTLRRAKRLLRIRSLKPARDCGWLWSPADGGAGVSDNKDAENDTTKRTVPSVSSELAPPPPFL